MGISLLIISGSLSFIAALLHVGIVIGGPRWYRFFGAGETMALLAEKGSVKPTVVTLAIAAMLGFWGLIAWSGAGILPAMPLLIPALAAITTIYLVRGLGGLVVPFVSDHPQIQQNSVTFWVWSSAICIVIGSLHLMGLISLWQ
jgi:hypothetical protein